MAPVAPMVEFSGSVMEQSAKTFPPDRKSSGFKSAKEELFADIELLQALESKHQLAPHPDPSRDIWHTLARAIKSDRQPMSVAHVASFVPLQTVTLQVGRIRKGLAHYLKQQNQEDIARQLEGTGAARSRDFEHQLYPFLCAYLGALRDSLAEGH